MQLSPFSLVITAPANESVTSEASVMVEGLGAPGSEIVRDIPFAFDDRTTAAADGSWSMSVDLSIGPNRLVFRVGDDESTVQILDITRVPPAAVGSEPGGPTEEAEVVRITDGDTIRVVIGGAEYRLRYIGIDAPETNKPSALGAWMAQAATVENESLVSGQYVYLEKDVSNTDAFGRLLRYVWLHNAAGWLMVNAELVRLGYAFAYPYPPDIKYQDLFSGLASAAEQSGLGVWGSPAPTSSPITLFATDPPTPKLGGNCDPAYPDFCIPPPPPDLDCGDIGVHNFTVLPPDPHRFDGDHDGIGCES